MLESQPKVPRKRRKTLKHIVGTLSTRLEISGFGNKQGIYDIGVALKDDKSQPALTLIKPFTSSYVFQLAFLFVEYRWR